MIFIAYNVMNLLHLDQINLAQGLLARFSPQTQTILIAENDLDVEEAPGDKLPGQTLVRTLANLFQETVVEHILVVRRQPDIVLRLLHTAKKAKWVSRLERN